MAGAGRRIGGGFGYGKDAIGRAIAQVNIVGQIVDAWEISDEKIREPIFEDAGCLDEMDHGMDGNRIDQRGIGGAEVIDMLQSCRVIGEESLQGGSQEPKPDAALIR